MEFQSEDEAYNFYNRYGLVVGFSVRKDYLNKDKDGVVTLRRYTCCKEGISLKQSHELMGKEAGGLGNIGYTRDDLERYLRTKRERRLKYGETGAMLRYFEELVHYSSLFVI
ncbi:uncharacterized protein LOC113757708 [Coffea eugenioides]|uniref:uncharacterized protein LOC113757708 n=1 Tax=Coffea eugenioides TaxID=49369 RepID=UPI000F609A06|nr:uncharacterized protein LOC113757708 [Coffea eugenioides]